MMPSTPSQTLTILTFALLTGGLTALGAQETLPGILPGRSTPEVDSLLQRLETEYEEMDVDGFVSLFTEDFTQHDVNRRVRVSGIDAWHEQTVQVNAGHRWMVRVHGQRLVEGNIVIVEIEWSGLVRGEALGQTEDREYRYSGLGVIELEGGRIRSQVLYADFVTLADQLRLQIAPTKSPSGSSLDDRLRMVQPRG